MMDFTLEPGFTLEQALAIAYGDDLDVEAIYVEPPEANVLTDEDSADDEEGGDLDRLPPKQLLANAEIVLQNNGRIGTNGDVSGLKANGQEEGIEDQDRRIEDQNQETPQRIISTSKKYSWISGDFEPPKKEFPIFDYSQYENMSPVELFELFFDDSVFELLSLETKKYTAFKNQPDINISIEEIKCFFAILILSGYNFLPGKRFYWDSKSDMRNNSVSEAMRRNRFFQIMRYIHCADNNKVDNADKVWKVRPLMKKLKDNFVKFFIPEQNIDYDESMIRYYGRHGCKQFIRGKPIRFGFKMWCINAMSGYLLNFDMYQGKNPNTSEADEKIFGKCTAPFIGMLAEVTEVKNVPYNFFFDNLFTNINLLTYLRDNGFSASGTIRENKIPKCCPLQDKKRMDKTAKKGDHDSIIERENGIIFLRWKDNSVVTAASTHFGLMPFSQVKRYSKSEKSYVQVPRPFLITQYNNGMGGTDLMDENINRYRIGIRSKKWWWCIFTWLIDVAICNAWILHRKSGRKVSQLEFRREIVDVYLRRHGNPSKGPGRPATSRNSVTSNRVSDDIRYDRLDHLLVGIPEKKKRRCAGEGCSSIMRTMCQKCGVGLCVECNPIFHNK